MIKNNILHKSQSEPPADKPSPANPPGNPIYPASEDIYSKASRADNANPETDPQSKNLRGKIKRRKEMKKILLTTGQETTWMFQDPNWMIRRKMSVARMKKIIITA
jgi:hypothetical protein